MSLLTSYPTPLHQRLVLSPLAVSILHTLGDPAELLGPHRTIWTTSFLPPHIPHPPMEILIPQHLHSLQSVEFLGFAPPTALTLWERFHLRAELASARDPPPRLLDVVMEHLARFSEADVLRGQVGDGEGDGLRAWTRRWGLDWEFLCRLRATEWWAAVGRGGGRSGLRAWVAALVDMRWRFLVGLEGVLRSGEWGGVVSGLHPASLAVGLR
ncbi:hypothetical protein MMC15_006166 [Xylographa vitiligo]|nr:hypothetical protein [Xylographa vitiligo]